MIETQSNICPNCKHLNSSDYSYCESCGQKNQPLKITFFDFIKDFMDVVFNLDNKFWKTLKVLFIPGRLTRIFFQGMRKSFYHPLRLYLVAVIFLFTVLSLLKLDSIIDLNVGGNLKSNFEKRSILLDQATNIKNTLDSLKTSFPSVRDKNLLDSVRKNLFLTTQQDSIPLDSLEFRDSTSLSLFSTKVRVSYKELFIDDIEDVVKSAGLEQPLDKFAFRQFLKGARDLNSLNAFIFANLTWLFLAIIPVFSLVLKLFYVRRNKYYMEHFVFLLHLFTALIFLYGFVVLALVPFDKNLIAGIICAVIAVFYPFIAFKTYYRQGIIKTLVKFTAIGMAFLLAFIFTFLIFILATAALF